MAISSSPVNQGTGVWSSGSSMTVTITAPTSGNILVLCYASSSSGVSISASGVTCTNVTWNSAATITSGTNQRGEVWFGKVNASAGTTVTINLSGTPLNGMVNVSEWSGIDTTGSEKDAGACSGNSGNTSGLTSAVVTPTNSSANILFIGGGRHAGALTTANFSDGTSGATWASLTQPASSALFTYHVATSTSGTYGFHSTWGASGVWDCTIAGFKASSSAFTAKFRKTLSGIGSRVGSRQVHNS